MRICTRCVLPETFPGIRFDEDGVCNFCLAYRGEKDVPRKQAAFRRKFEELAERVRGRSGYHCLLAYSGGKDSSYTLWLLRKQYDLRVLTVTFDNGFISPLAFTNIRRVVEALNADSIIIKPRLDLLTKVFTSVLADNPYPMKALERASGICNACIGFVKNIILRLALDGQIPMIAYGWSPGQAPISAGLFRMNAPMIRQMHEARSAPLIKIAGEMIRPYLLDERHFAERDELPYNVNPLAFHEYNEHRIVTLIEELGWEVPQDTDGNSTNCLLNGYCNRVHLKEFGFHPYAFEVAGLVRAGVMTRDEGLASLDDLGSEATAASVARQLGADAGSA